jgi:hypothetical protein
MAEKVEALGSYIKKYRSFGQCAADYGKQFPYGYVENKLKKR